MSYEYPQAVSQEAYNSLVMAGVPAEGGTISVAEVTFHSEYGPNWYGNSAPSASLGSYVNLTSNQVLFMFSEPITGYTNRNLGGTTLDIGGIGVYYYDSKPHLCPVDPSGDLMTAYAGPEMSLPNYAEMMGVGSQIYIVMSYQSQNGGHVPAVAVGAKVDMVNNPIQYAKDHYTYNLCSFTNVGNDIFEYALHDNYWDPYDQAPDNEDDGGGGGYNPQDDQIDYPGNPIEGAISTGMMTMYRVTSAELHSLSTKLWDTSFFSSIIKNWTDPMQNIISLHQIPLDPSAINVQASHIYVGNVDTQIDSHKVIEANQWVDVTFDPINVAQSYKNFVDFDANIEIYLPYVGYRSLDIKDCMDGQLVVKYKIDLLTGDFIARVEAKSSWTVSKYSDAKDHVIMQENGNMALNIPLSMTNYMSVYTALFSAVGSAASKDVGGAASSLMNAKPTYGSKGNLATNAGALSVSYPYVIIRRPQFKAPKTFNKEQGVISNITGSLGSNTGFVSVVPGSLDLEGIPCTSDEREMMIDLLEGGVIVNSFT